MTIKTFSFSPLLYGFCMTVGLSFIACSSQQPQCDPIHLDKFSNLKKKLSNEDWLSVTSEGESEVLNINFHPKLDQFFDFTDQFRKEKLKREMIDLKLKIGPFCYYRAVFQTNVPSSKPSRLSLSQRIFQDSLQAASYIEIERILGESYFYEWLYSKKRYIRKDYFQKDNKVLYLDGLRDLPKDLANRLVLLIEEWFGAQNLRRLVVQY